MEVVPNDEIDQWSKKIPTPFVWRCEYIHHMPHFLLLPQKGGDLCCEKRMNGNIHNFWILLLVMNDLRLCVQPHNHIDITTLPESCLHPFYSSPRQHIQERSISRAAYQLNFSLSRQDGVDKSNQMMTCYTPFYPLSTGSHDSSGCSMECSYALRW